MRAYGRYRGSPNTNPCQDSTGMLIQEASATV